MQKRSIVALATAQAILLLLTVTTARAQPQLDRPARISGHPNLNGVWQALNTAYWNLEAHSVEAMAGSPGSNNFWQLGAIAAIPAGRSVVREGTIPYLPEALKKRCKIQPAHKFEDASARAGASIQRDPLRRETRKDL